MHRAITIYSLAPSYTTTNSIHQKHNAMLYGYKRNINDYCKVRSTQIFGLLVTEKKKYHSSNEGPLLLLCMSMRRDIRPEEKKTAHPTGCRTIVALVPHSHVFPVYSFSAGGLWTKPLPSYPSLLIPWMGLIRSCCLLLVLSQPCNVERWAWCIPWRIRWTPPGTPWSSSGAGACRTGG